MDPLRILAETHGFFVRAEAHGAGHDDNSIRRAVRSRLWVRIRQGAYTFPDLWEQNDEVGRHLVTARAVIRRLGDRVCLSHTTAALLHGMDVWDADLSVVHVTRLDGGAGRTEAGVVHHEALCLDDDLTVVAGLPATKPARAALETAAITGSEPGVVVLDNGLHRRLFTPEEMFSTFALMQHWPGALHLELAVRFADGRAESVGESRSRYLCYAYGLPAPDLQFKVYDERGVLIGITDMVWREHGLLGEFDGKAKYGRLLRPGEEPGDAVFREKRREDALRRVTGYSMVRITWTDLYRPRETAAMIRGLFRSAA